MFDVIIIGKGPAGLSAGIYTAMANLNTLVVGKESAIYVDKTENQFYRWDSENLTYKKMGSDYHDIKVINGGTSKTTY